MKSHIIKGIISAVVTFILFLVMSFVLMLFMERRIFLYNMLDIFPLNAFGIIVLAIFSLIPIVFCKFKNFAEMLIYSVSYFLSFRVLCMVVFFGLYAIAITLLHYGVELPAVISGDFLGAMSYNLFYMRIGFVIGFVCSIVVNIIRNIREKNCIKADSNT